MRFIACMMNQGSWRVLPPGPIALLPRSHTCQRQVDLLRFMAVARIVGCRPEQQEATRNSCAGNFPAEPNDLAPSVVTQELRVDIGCLVSLPPGHTRRHAAQLADQLDTETGCLALHST